MEMNILDKTKPEKEKKASGNDSTTSDESEVDEELETLSWDGMDDRDCFATVKTVCDTFALHGSNSNEYFFYRVCVSVPEELASAGCGSAKDELDQSVSALNGLGFILRSPIPSDVLLAKSDLFLSDSMMVMTIHCVGRQTSIPESDLLQMQRFHRAVCCMEDVNAYNTDAYLNIDHDFGDGADPVELIPEEEWIKSSNGAWYVVYPLQDQGNTIPTENQCYNSGYLKRCADQAQALMHNLRVVGASDTKATCRMPEAESCAQYHQDAWKDLLILANGISLCCAAADTVHNRKTLNDVMKRVKYTPPPAPPAPEFVVVPAQQEGSVVPFPAPLVVMRPEDAGPIPTVRVNYSKYIDITYADHFKAKRPHLTALLEQYQKDPEHRLLAANQVSTKTAHTLLLTPICEDVRGNPDWIKRNSVHNARVERLHFLAEQCRPLGLQRWYFTSRLVPSVMHRIQSWCLAYEARELMTQRIAALDDSPQDGATSALGKPETDTIQDNEMQLTEEMNEVNLDGTGTGTPKHDFSRVPSLKLMLEAMTPRMVAESFDSERLETLGDAFLKYVISVELYKIRPDMREGQLTSARAAFINNRKQCQVCLSTGMSKFIRVIALSRGERLVTVCAPGMPAADLLPARSTWGTDIMAVPAERKYRVEAMYRFPKPQHQRRTVLFKKFADMVEAVIAAYYVDGGEEAGIAAVKAFCTWPRNATPAASAPPAAATLQPPPPVSATASAGAKACHAAMMAAYNNRVQTPQPATFGSPPGGRGKHYRGGPVHNSTSFHARFGGRPELYPSGGPKERPPEDSPSRKRPCANNFASPLAPPFRYSPGPGFVPPPPSTPPPPPSRPKTDLADLETNLQYAFKDRNLLRLALTHSSMSRCNNAERLEFLGDAVLDFVTVSYWFRHNVAFEPMDLHEAKSRNTCNRNLASKAYSLGLHRFLQHNSEHLQTQLEQYCAEHFARDHPADAVSPVLGTGASKNKASSPGKTAKDGAEGAVSTSDVLADTLEAVIGAIFLDCGEDTRVIEQFAAHNNLLVA